MREAGTSEKCQVEQARTRLSRAVGFAVDHERNGGKVTA
jgi:hypothetical protein